MRVFVWIILAVSLGAQGQTLTTGQLVDFENWANRVRAKCAKQHRKGKPCKDLKYIDMAPKVAADAIAKGALLRSVRMENSKLKTQVQGKLYSEAPLTGPCQYKDFRREKMALYSIPEQGGGNFIKRGGVFNPEGQNCYVPSSRATGAKIYYCENGDFINIKTESGPPTKPIVREEDYLFERSQGRLCQLKRVHVIERQSDKTIYEAQLEASECQKLYAAYKLGFREVASMQDGLPLNLARLGFCLKMDLLPSPESSLGVQKPASKDKVSAP